MLWLLFVVVCVVFATDISAVIILVEVKLEVLVHFRIAGLWTWKLESGRS